MDLLTWTACPILSRMSIRSLMRNRFAFDAIQALAGGPLSFTEVHQAVGCTGRTMSRTLKAVVADGSVRQLAEGPGGYQLTVRGRAVLADWSRLMAHDGEPVGLASPWAQEQIGRGYWDGDRMLRTETMAPASGQFVDTSEFARNKE